MNRICEYLLYYNNKFLNSNITYYVRLSPEELISINPDNNINSNIDIINYMLDIIHKYFYKYEYEIIFDYIIPMITYKFNNYLFKIKFNKRYDEKLYWILIIQNN